MRPQVLLAMTKLGRPFKENKVKALLQEISQYKATISLALAVGER
jgi:hypothetical protein